jgi:hypothetical protein
MGKLNFLQVVISTTGTVSFTGVTNTHPELGTHRAMVVSPAVVTFTSISAADVRQQEWSTMAASEGRLSFIRVESMGLLKQDMFDSLPSIRYHSIYQYAQYAQET